MGTNEWQKTICIITLTHSNLQRPKAKNESVIECCLKFPAAELEHKCCAEMVLKDVAVDLLSHMTGAT